MDSWCVKTPLCPILRGHDIPCNERINYSGSHSRNNLHTSAERHCLVLALGRLQGSFQTSLGHLLSKLILFTDHVASLPVPLFRDVDLQPAQDAFRLFICGNQQILKQYSDLALICPLSQHKILSEVPRASGNLGGPNPGNKLFAKYTGNELWFYYWRGNGKMTTGCWHGGDWGQRHKQVPSADEPGITSQPDSPALRSLGTSVQSGT